MNLRLTSFQKLALSTTIAVYAMIVIGVIVRSTGSGLGCGDWPLCRGAIIPVLEGANAWDSADWIESIHRWWGVIVGFLVLGLGVMAWRTHRATRSIVVAAIVDTTTTETKSSRMVNPFFPFIDPKPYPGSSFDDGDRGS